MHPSLFILRYVTDASRPVPSHLLQGKRDAAKSLEHMALQLKQAPKAAAHSMQQTFENAQHNYKFLGDFIQVLDNWHPLQHASSQCDKEAALP